MVLNGFLAVMIS